MCLSVETLVFPCLQESSANSIPASQIRSRLFQNSVSKFFTVFRWKLMTERLVHINRG